MTKTKITIYTIIHDTYERKTARMYRNFEFAATRKQAERWARRMGVGATITQTSKTRSGKWKRKTWVLNRIQNRRLND